MIVVGLLLFLGACSLLFLRNSIIAVKRIFSRHSLFRVKALTVIISPLVLFILSVTALAYTAHEVYENSAANRKSPPSASVSPSEEPDSADPVPDFPESPPITKEEDISLTFRLSEVKDSAMLTLDKRLLGDAPIDADQLVSAADEQLGAYIAQYCQGAPSFPFYPDLAKFFPPGENISYSFDEVSSLEECDAQLRGTGARLERCRADGTREQMGEIYHQLAIRSRDALKFTKYQKTRSQKDGLIWLYSEISFSSLLNEYICVRPEGLALSDWYYRTAQVFDYLGGVADTEELEQRMYFLSAVFLRCAFEMLKEQGIRIYLNAYDCEIWTLYVKMLYRVTRHMEPARAGGFYLEIRDVETTVLRQSLPDTVIAQTAKALNELELYQEWRGRYG